MRNFLTLVFVIIGFRIFSYKLIPGFYITNNNDTIKTSFEINFGLGTQGHCYKGIYLVWAPNLFKLEKGVFCKDSMKREKFLSPSNIKEFCFVYKNILFKMASIHYNQLVLDKQDHNEVYSEPRSGFYYVIVDGYLKLCHHWTSKYWIYYFLQKGNNKVFACTNGSKKFLDYFSDCPQAKAKLENTGSYYPDLAEIVKFYNNNCPKNVFDLKDYSLPNFHDSKSHFSSTFAKKYNFIVETSVDNQKQFLGETFSDKWLLKIYKYKYAWSLPITEIVKDKIKRDLSLINAIDTSGQAIYIKPSIEVFFAVNSGFFLNTKTNSKIRIKFTAYNFDRVELFSKTYETFYSSSGLDKEYEGGFFTWESDPPNIVLGVCLRKTLDKFYADISNGFN